VPEWIMVLLGSLGGEYSLRSAVNSCMSLTLAALVPYWTACVVALVWRAMQLLVVERRGHW
jgi:hypothetical protein